jgi:hypothetical protein
MADIKVSIINESTVLSDEQIQSIVPALQTQVSQHFAPPWGVDADLTFVGKGQAPQSGEWWLAILDDSDQAGALGYHETTSEGLPCGKVFARTDLDNHLSWSVTISHELLEMLADPDINLTTFIQDTAKTGKLYSYEVCDPVEDDQFSYLIDGVQVSDFVLPCYFEPQTSAGSGMYDYGGHLASPVPALLTGGYLSQFDIAQGQGWTQVTAATEGQPHRGHLRIGTPGGRAGRRRLPHKDWKRSEPRLVPMRRLEPRLVPMDHGPEPRPEPRLVPMQKAGAEA